MAPRRDIPPPRQGGPSQAVRQPVPGGPRSAPTPQAPASVAEVQLSASIPALDGTPLTTIRFTRPPGLGELIGWLDDSSLEACATSLEVLPWRPEWIIMVLGKCAGIPEASARRISVADFTAVAQALLPFFGPPRGGSTGASSPSSPSDTAGAPETSQH